VYSSTYSIRVIRCCRWEVVFTPRLRTRGENLWPLSVNFGVGCASETVWPLWKGQTSLVLAENWTAAPCLVTVKTKAIPAAPACVFYLTWNWNDGDLHCPERLVSKQSTVSFVTTLDPFLMWRQSKILTKHFIISFEHIVSLEEQCHNSKNAHFELCPQELCLRPYLPSGIASHVYFLKWP
jgi:hypothetical protein